MSLKTKIVELIKSRRSMPIDEFMAYVVPHYYENNVALGKDGDFITAPEISQMFGEMLGMWSADVWLKAGSLPFALAELGPGRGTLMSDLLRSTKNVPGFHESLQSINLIERSSSLKSNQQEQLRRYESKIVWHEDLSDMPNIFTIYIANEFFDALPIKQYKREKGKVYEKLVGLDGEELIFLYSDNETLMPPANADDGLFEVSAASDAYADQLAELMVKNKGTVVIIDYGYTEDEKGDTLQAMKSHKFHDVLKDIGEADITAHVNFKRLGSNFQNKGLKVEVKTQAQFLLEHGILLRATELAKKTLPGRIASEMDRLLASNQMGQLFKVLIATA